MTKKEKLFKACVAAEKAGKVAEAEKYFRLLAKELYLLHLIIEEEEK